MSDSRGAGLTADQQAMADEVRSLLSRPQPELSPKWFYDARGSALFDEITRQPEYYPTRTERALLRDWAAPRLAAMGTRALVELGPGNGEKAWLLLDALPNDVTYVPVDISATYLETIAEDMHRRYPDVDVMPLEADITQAIRLPDALPTPAVVAFLGSTVGNFDPLAAQRLLRRIRDTLRAGDTLLLGADQKKDRRVLEAAYNDAAGVTAQFNLNVLHVLNRELGADFDVDAFEHRAIYNEEDGRIEMHLVSLRDQDVRIPGAGEFHFAHGDTIRTELSTKYDRASLEQVLGAAGLRIDEWHTDEDGNFALVLAVRA